MKVVFLYNKKARQEWLCLALRAGMLRHGDEFERVVYNDQPYDMDCDAIAFEGMKCREWHEHCVTTGMRFLYFDKGYYYPKEQAYSRSMQRLNVWRVSVDSNQPLKYLAEARHTATRWDKFQPPPMKRWREPTASGHIIIAGSSEKYHKFHNLPHPTVYHQRIVNELRQYTDRPIHYRPKPSWWLRSPEQAVPIDGAEFVPERSFEERAKGAHAVITHGSNAALIGMLQGIPSIIIGNGVMRPISSTELCDIETPYLATDAERRQLLANLAYSQWTLSEWQNGSAWHHVKTTFLQ